MRSHTLIVLSVLTAFAGGVSAQEQSDAAQQRSPYKDFAELTKGAAAIEGFLDLYQKGDQLWLAIPPDRLGEDFLLEMKIAQGVGAAGLFGGTMLDIFEGKVMSLERHGDRVFLLKRPHRFTAKNDPAAAKAVELTFTESVLESAKIESFRTADSAVVVPVQDWFVSDLSNVGTRVKNAVGRGNTPFDKARSYIESVKSFPENTNIRARLTYRPSEPINITSVPDGRSISLSIHYTLAALPAEPMTPRIADDRVGNFMTVHKDFSNEDSTFFVRYVNRWRLEPGERVGDRWRPREPITYYIDANVPEEYRDVFKAGVEGWNAAFEAAGWVDAIRALDLPEGADPEDIRYATLRWNVSDEPGYGAIGPSVVDPRTGEVLDADILFEASMFQGQRSTWRSLAGPVSAADALEQALGVNGNTLDPSAGTELPGFASSFIDQGAVLAAALVARGEIGPNDPVPPEYLEQATKWVVMHEVGHTLGLQHNFRSSASTPFDRLHDREWAEENGVFSSVMEYPTVNIAPPGTSNGYYYNPGAGSYDRWAVSFAYTQDDARAAELARQVADRKHLYGTNAESGGPGALDPSINTYDLSDDPLAWGTERTSIVAGLWEKLPEYVLDDNESYYTVTSAFQSLLRDYARALAPSIKYIGGQYINRDHAGDPDGRLPFENVPVAKQRQALELIVDRAFAAQAFEIPQDVLARMGSNRWLHWGQNGTFDGRLDFPLHQQVLEFQSTLLAQLLHPSRLARIRDAETKYGVENVVTIPEMMDALSASIWSELDGAANITAMRRDLQRAYLDAMVKLLVDPEEGTPADARSVARLQLTRLAGRVESRLGSSDPDAYTRAHLEESAARIDKALEASITTTM